MDMTRRNGGPSTSRQFARTLVICTFMFTIVASALLVLTIYQGKSDLHRIDDEGIRVAYYSSTSDPHRDDGDEPRYRGHYLGVTPDGFPRNQPSIDVTSRVYLSSANGIRASVAPYMDQ